MVFAGCFVPGNPAQSPGKKKPRSYGAFRFRVGVSSSCWRAPAKSRNVAVALKSRNHAGVTGCAILTLIAYSPTPLAVPSPLLCLISSHLSATTGCLFHWKKVAEALFSDSSFVAAGKRLLLRILRSQHLHIRVQQCDFCRLPCADFPGASPTGCLDSK
jgi:hypothetical protein